MPIPRLHTERTALLVIDVQERLMPSIAHSERTIINSALLLRMATVLEIPAIITEHYPKGLGPSVSRIQEVMPKNAAVVEKTRFSALVDEVDRGLRQCDGGARDTILIAGVEAHVCVLQTVLDLHATGRQCFVCTDAVSGGAEGQIAPAFRRMERAGAVLTGVLSAMYELMVDAKHPKFKQCLEIAKSLQE